MYPNPLTFSGSKEETWHANSTGENLEAKGSFGKSLVQCGHCRGSVNKCFSVGYVRSRDYTDRVSLRGRCETDRKIFRNHRAPLWHPSRHPEIIEWREAGCALCHIKEE